MHYTCHRCGHDVARTARDCAACGKPIAPLPWHRKIRAPGRRAPDAHVLDYARTTATPRFVVVVSFYAFVVLLFLFGMRLAGGSPELDPGTAPMFLASMDEHGIEPHVRNGVQFLLDRLQSMAKALRWTSGFVVWLGITGIVLEAGTYSQTRRLVAIIEDPGGTPGDRAGGRP